MAFFRLQSPVDKLIFPVPSTSYDDSSFPWLSSDMIWLRDSVEGYQFPVVVMQPQLCLPERVILYLHGNACDIGEVWCNFQGEPDAWRSIIALVEYPGYGQSPGLASAQSIDRHVRIAFDHFTRTLGIPASRVVLYGCSVGTGPAAKLAWALQKEGTPCGCVVMQSPYTSIRDAAASLVGFVAYIIFERWDNMRYAKRISCPWLILHGTRDEVIPYTHATALKAQREKSSLPARRRLLSPPSRRARECGEAANSAGALRRLPTAGAAAAAAARTQCIFYAQPDATHNNYDAKADLSDPVRDFLRRFHEQRAPLTIKPGQFQTSATAKEPDLPGIMGCM